jgi:hypothetical protein
MVSPRNPSDVRGGLEPCVLRVVTRQEPVRQDRDNPVDFDYEAEVEIGFAEDLTYGEVAGLLDAFAATRVFTVRASRVGWSGPAAGGPEIGLALEIAAGIGLGVFAKTFCEELAKDSYKAVRAALLALVSRLRDKDPEERRAVVGLQIVVGDVRVCIGPLLKAEPTSEDWTDEWLLERLRRTQEIVEDTAAVAALKAQEAEVVGPKNPCEYWLK